jgi:hypothetical protein
VPEPEAHSRARPPAGLAGAALGFVALWGLVLSELAAHAARRAIVSFVVASAFGFVGLVVGLLRPGQPVPFRLCLFSLAQAALGLAQARADALAALPAWHALFQLPLAAGYPLNLLAGYSTVLAFFEGSAQLALWRRLWPWLLGSGLLLAAAVVAHEALVRFGPLGLLPAGVEAGYQLVYRLWYLPAAALAAGAFAFNYRHLDDPHRRRQLRWIVWALGAAVAIQIAFVAARTLGGVRAIERGGWPDLALLLLPAATAHALLARRLFDVQVVVRRGLRYLLARNALRALLVLPGAALVHRLVTRADRTLAEIASQDFVFLALVGAVVASLRFREPLLAWLDRRFFRQAGNREARLLALVAQVRALDSETELARFLGDGLALAFQPESCRLFLRATKGGDFLAVEPPAAAGAARAAPDSADRTVTLEARAREPADSPLARRLAALGEPAEIDRDLSASSPHLAGGVELAVPVAGGDGELVGFLLLGRKWSEEPYSAEDKSLLHALAGAIALAHENRLLRSRVSEGERVQREVLSRLADDGRNLVRECPVCGRCDDSVAERCAEDGSALELRLPVDRRVAERYRLDRRLGAGGMGVVYAATDTRMARGVAVKLLVGGRFGDHRARERFEREARAAARLSHPNVVVAFDYGPLPPDGAYLAMELLSGRTLRAELNRRGRLAPALAARWLAQLLDGLEAAHAAGIVHRDLKPENVMLAGDGDAAPVKILDFGLARLADAGDAGASLTAPGAVLGTLRYMSPEQLAGRAVDSRTDLHAVGVVARELLTGTNPFAGATATETVAAVLQGAPPLPAGSGALRRLDAALARATARRPEDRPASVRALRDELLPAIAACDPTELDTLFGSAALSATDATREEWR